MLKQQFISLSTKGGLFQFPRFMNRNMPILKYKSYEIVRERKKEILGTREREREREREIGQDDLKVSSAW